MKSFKRRAAALASGGLCVGALLASAGPAQAVNQISSGHIDGVTVTCRNTGGTITYDVFTTIDGNPHGADRVDTGSGTGQIGDYLFLHDASDSPSAVRWIRAWQEYLVGGSGRFADIGFTYDCADSGAADQVTIAIDEDLPADDLWAVTVAGTATNTDGTSVITLPRTGSNHHVHGNWYFEAPLFDQDDHEIAFDVTINSRPIPTTATIGPVHIRVQP